MDKNFLNFIDGTPNAYICVQNLKEQLLANGFKKLAENEHWQDIKEEGSYFVIRNDSSLITFKVGSKVENAGFNIVSVHSDSPCFQIKPNAEKYDKMYLKLNTDKYGSMIYYTWLDRPLSLAGRVITLTNGVFASNFVNIDKDLLVIPSEALHINRKVNKELKLNPQKDLLPILSLEDAKLEDIIRDYLLQKGIVVDKILDYDLFLYNRDKARIIGLKNELIVAPRLDDLGSLYPAFCGFMDANPENAINVFCAFNNEEIGSLTMQGADSPFLYEVLTRITNALGLDLYATLANSFVISADNGHANHPNAQEKSDITNKVEMNKGVVVKHNRNYTTDALTSALFKAVCENASVPYQDFAFRSDMLCGGTLGLLSQRHVDVDSVDIGLAQLAMHSANETMGTYDLGYMYKAIKEFYGTTFVKEKGRIRLR